jgi:hypothetical protein
MLRSSKVSFGCAVNQKTPDIAFALAGLAISSYKTTSRSGANAVKLGNACCWALANMPIRDGIAQLNVLKDKIENNSAQKMIEKTLAVTAK